MPHLTDIRTLLQQLITVHKHIIEINQPPLYQTILIFLIDPSKRISRTIWRIVMCQIHSAAFHTADLRTKIIQKFIFVLNLNIGLVHNLLQKLTPDVLLDDIARLIMICMLQNSEKNRMKCTERYRCTVCRCHLLITLAHLHGSRPGKCDNKNVGRIYAFLLY